MMKKDGPIEVLHVVNNMRQGGVEMVTANIIQHNNNTHLHHHILVLGKDKSFEDTFAGLPVEIHYLRDMSAKEQIKLAHDIDVVHVAQSKAAFMTTPFAKILNKPLVLGVHYTLMKTSDEQSRTHRFYYNHIEPKIAQSASQIVCCTDVVAKGLEQRNWSMKKVRVITNGINTDQYKRDSGARDTIRQQLGLSSDMEVIGLSARYTPMKDIATFIEAAKIIKERNPEQSICFLLCGNRMDAENIELVRDLKAAGIYENCKLIGVHTDMPAIYSAMDIQVLSSFKGEALSMALMEGTACGTLCVTTDVGDHRKLMEKTGGICVPPRDSKALADGIDAYLAMSTPERSEKMRSGRNAIIHHHDVRYMAKSYNDLFQEVGLSKAKQRPGWAVN